MPQVSINEDKIPLLHGFNGKFTANVNAVLPTDPFPVSANAIASIQFSADNKVSIGNDVSLGISASTSATLAALFKEQTGAASDLVKTFGLDSSLTNTNFILAFDLGGKADLSASGSFKYNLLTVSPTLDAGVDGRLVNTRVYDNRTESIIDVLTDFVANLATPGSVTKPPRPGEIVYLEFGGYLNFGASLSAGYEMSGTSNFLDVASLKLSELYKLSVTGKLSLAAKLAGRFSVQVQNASDLHPTDPGWARVKVNRQRSSDLQITADVGVAAEIDTQGLPTTGKELLGSLLGLRAKNWINQADAIISQAASIKTAADLTSKLDGLAQIYISRVANKAVSALSTTEVPDLLDRLKSVVDGYNTLGDNAVALFDRYFDRIDTALSPVLNQIEALGSLDQFQGEIDPVLWNVAQQLTGGNVIDAILDKTTGLTTLRDGAKKVLDLIENPLNQKIRDFIAISKKEFDLDNIVNELSKFDTLDKLKTQASDVANHVVQRILGKAVSALSSSDFKDLVNFIQEVAKGEQGFFGALDTALTEAASQKFTADISLSYDRSDETTALIDVDIRLVNPDGSSNAAGIAFMKSAGMGDFTAILAKYDPSVVQLRNGTLTHQLTTSSGIKINVAGWHQNFQYQSIRKVVLNTRQQIQSTLSGMLNVFTNVNVTATSDTTRTVNKHEEGMHAAFIIRFIAESTTPTLSAANQKYLLDVITASGAEYTLQLVDSDTTPAKFERMLGFAAAVGLDKKGANSTALQPVLKLTNGSFGPVEVDYDVRFSGAGLQKLFTGGVALDVTQIHSILRQVVMANYVNTGLEPVAWLFCSDTVRNLALGDGNFMESDTLLVDAGPLVFEIPFAGMTPVIENTKTVRQFASTLFRIEESIIDAMQRLHDAVQKRSLPLASLEKVAKSLGDALNNFDAQTDLSRTMSNPLFAVFDRLIQLANPGAQTRNSAMVLKLGPSNTPDQQKTILFQIGDTV
jgi:hypothetical protein